MLIVCDIDLTIADGRDRFKGLGEAPPTKNRRALQLWLDKLQPEDKLVEDLPIQPVIDILISLSKRPNYKLVYLTGRSEKYRPATMRWLKQANCPKAPLLMRPHNDWRTPKNCKMEMMKKLSSQYGNEIMILDDDGAGDCSKAYTKAGWLHLKVIL